MGRTVEIIGVQMDMGASKRGVSMGPAAIRYGGLEDGLREMGYEVIDRGDILPIPKGATSEEMRNYEQVVDINRKLFNEVSGILDGGNFPVVLGATTASRRAASKPWRNSTRRRAASA